MGSQGFSAQTCLNAGDVGHRDAPGLLNLCEPVLVFLLWVCMSLTFFCLFCFGVGRVLLCNFVIDFFVFLLPDFLPVEVCEGKVHVNNFLFRC